VGWGARPGKRKIEIDCVYFAWAMYARKLGLVTPYRDYEWFLLLRTVIEGKKNIPTWGGAVPLIASTLSVTT